MGQLDPPLSYEELLNVFDEALDCELSGSPPPPATALFSGSVTLALAEVGRAVREKRSNHASVVKACKAFASYASSDNDEWRDWQPTVD